MNISLEEVVYQAHEELAEEAFRTKVDETKERMRRHVPLLRRLFPWKITINRRDTSV